MKQLCGLLTLAFALSLVGCTEEDPTKRPDFVDTSNPGEVMKTMKAPPGGGPGAPGVGVGPGAPGPGAPGPGGAGP
jgi:hypothetical protein